MQRLTPVFLSMIHVCAADCAEEGSCFSEGRKLIQLNVADAKVDAATEKNVRACPANVQCGMWGKCYQPPSFVRSDEFKRAPLCGEMTSDTEADCHGRRSRNWCWSGYRPVKDLAECEAAHTYLFEKERVQGECPEVRDTKVVDEGCPGQQCTCVLSSTSHTMYWKWGPVSNEAQICVKQHRYEHVGVGHCFDSQSRWSASCQHRPLSKEACEEKCSKVSACKGYRTDTRWGGDWCMLILKASDLQDTAWTCTHQDHGAEIAGSVTSDIGAQCYKKV